MVLTYFFPFFVIQLKFIPNYKLMSFAGHVFDMIRRNKEDREKLSQLRGKGKDMRTKYSSHIPDISVEEYEKINQQLKERERNEQIYISRIKLFALAAIIAIVMLSWILFKLFSW